MGAPPQGLHVPSFQGQPLPTEDHLAQCRPSSSLACPASPVQGGFASYQGGALVVAPSISALDPPLQRKPEDPNCSPPGADSPQEAASQSQRGCGEAQGLFFHGQTGEATLTGLGGGGQLERWRRSEQPLVPSGFSLRCFPMGSLSLISPPPPVSATRHSSKAENPKGYTALAQSPSKIQGSGPTSPQSLRLP